MAGIASIGVGSGLELDSLLTNLVSAERVPTETRLAIREANIQSNISAFGGLKSALSKLQSSLTGLVDAEALSARSASSSDSSLFGANADGTAVAGRYSVQVLNLASAQKLASGNFTAASALVGSGTLSISSGTNAFDVAVAADATLGDVRDAINQATGNTSVSASLLTVDDGLGNGGTVTKLVLSARVTGQANAIGVAVSDDDANGTDDQGLSRLYFDANDVQSQLTEVEEALDARISVDGFAASSSTNRFTGVIDGVTITALREPADSLNPETATLTIGESSTVLVSRIQAFVTAYNEANFTIGELTKFNSATGAAGPLLGDATVRNINTALKRVLSDAVDGAGSYNTLSSLGIEAQRNGSLSLNTAKLNTAISNGLENVISVFASEDGIAQRLDSTLKNFLDSDGIIRARTEGFDKQLLQIEKQRDALILRVEAIEKRYRLQFTALDQVVTRLQSSGDFLLAQLENTSKIITGGGSN